MCIGFLSLEISLDGDFHDEERFGHSSDLNSLGVLYSSSSFKD